MEKEKLQAEIKRARNEYAKVWRAANKDKVKAAQERYWAKKILKGGGSDENPSV